MTISPDNQTCKRVAEIAALRAADPPCVPTEIAAERAIRFCAPQMGVQAHLNMAGAAVILPR